MKEFISGIAILLLLLIFPLQSQTDTINAFKINNFNEVVYSATEQARFDGRFTPENIKNIKEKLAAVFSVNENQVIVIATETQKYRELEYSETQKIEYKITVPFGTLLSSANFLDIDEEVNNRSISKSGYVFSEVLKP